MTAELWIQCYVHLAQHDHVCLLLLCQLSQDLADMDWLEKNYFELGVNQIYNRKIYD